MGPIALFDKSFLQMLNSDEAALFDALFSANICPIFYTEVLADLDKEPPRGRSAERIVADIARKTPVMHSTPNVLHASLCLSELQGHGIEMRRVPARPGGVPVRHEGKLGIVYDEADELKAFNRGVASGAAVCGAHRYRPSPTMAAALWMRHAEAAALSLAWARLRSRYL